MSQRGTILLLAQSPVMAILILLLWGFRAAAPISATSRPSVSESIASTMFALVLSAVWLGGSLAVWASLAYRPNRGRGRSFAARRLASSLAKLAVMAGSCLAQCGALLAVVHWGSGLRSEWLPMFGVLLLASGVSLVLGSIVCSLIRSSRIAVAVLMAAFLAMIALGGKLWPLPTSIPVAHIATAMPSRWAFEGLLLLEGERLPTPDAPDGQGADRDQDPAERYFPADSERMGTRADAMALGSMLIGLVAVAAFISSHARPGD